MFSRATLSHLTAILREKICDFFLGCKLASISFRKAVFTLRARFARTLRTEVARCVADPADVDAELAYLIRLVSE